MSLAPALVLRESDRKKLGDLARIRTVSVAMALSKARPRGMPGLLPLAYQRCLRWHR